MIGSKRSTTVTGTLPVLTLPSSSVAVQVTVNPATPASEHPYTASVSEMVGTEVQLSDFEVMMSDSVMVYDPLASNSAVNEVTATTVGAIISRAYNAPEALEFSTPQSPETST